MSPKLQNRTMFGGRRSLALPVNSSLAVPENLSLDWLELDEKVRSMMEKSQNNLGNRRGFAYLCKVCGKEIMSLKITLKHITLKELSFHATSARRPSALASIWGFTRQNIIRIRLAKWSYLPSKLLLNWNNLHLYLKRKNLLGKGGLVWLFFCDNYNCLMSCFMSNKNFFCALEAAKKPSVD